MSKPKDTYTRQAKVISVYDADTITVEVDLGFRITTTLPLRLKGIDAPELKTAEGKAARDYLKTILAVVGFVTIKTFKYPEDKYGRWLAEVYLSDDIMVNELLILKGYAKEYNGGKK